MGFFDEAFTEERAELAARRTKRQFEYACKHPEVAVPVIGALAALMVYMPAPIMIGLLVSALALMCANLFTPPKNIETFETVVSTFKGF